MIAALLTASMACPICFGDPKSQQVQAARLGVLFLLGVTLLLLGAIGLVIRTWVLRARALEQAHIK